MFAPTVRPFWFGNWGKIVERGVGGLTGWKRGWGDVGVEPYNPPVTYGDIPLFKGDEGLLRPDGHLLYKRRLSGEQCSPLR